MVLQQEIFGIGAIFETFNNENIFLYVSNAVDSEI